MDADNVSRVIVQRVPEHVVVMLHTSLLDAIEKAGWGRLQAVPFLGHDTGRVVLSESTVSQGLIPKNSTGFLKIPVGYLSPVGATVDCELPIYTTEKPDR